MSEAETKAPVAEATPEELKAAKRPAEVRFWPCSMLFTVDYSMYC